MRLWHYQLLPYLPSYQFHGQLRELIAIMHSWRDKGSTNSVIINQVMNYSKSELDAYWCKYYGEYVHRYKKPLEHFHTEFQKFVGKELDYKCYDDRYKLYKDWHNKEYLRICMANLYEKHKFGKGKSRITDEQWKVLCDGYRKITGEDYIL